MSVFVCKVSIGTDSYTGMKTAITWLIHKPLLLRARVGIYSGILQQNYNPLEKYWNGMDNFIVFFFFSIHWISIELRSGDWLGLSTAFLWPACFGSLSCYIIKFLLIRLNWQTESIGTLLNSCIKVKAEITVNHFIPTYLNSNVKTQKYVTNTKGSTVPILSAEAVFVPGLSWISVASVLVLFLKFFVALQANCTTLLISEQKRYRDNTFFPYAVMYWSLRFTSYHLSLLYSEKCRMISGLKSIKGLNVWTRHLISSTVFCDLCIMAYKSC